MSSLPQIVILCGGMATRLGDISKDTPKSMIYINGKPFIDYQLERLKTQGASSVLLCISHLGAQISNHVKDGRQYGLQVGYSWEFAPMGTGGALKRASPMLDGIFMLLYGDSYLTCDFRFVWRSYLLRSEHPDALMTVQRCEDGHAGARNACISNGWVHYNKRSPVEQMNSIDYGLSVLKKDALNAYVSEPLFDVSEYFQFLSKQNRLAGLEISEPFLEIGSLEGLEEFQSAVQDRRIL